MRAVLTVNDNSGRPRRFYAQWASPEFQIPHLARFLTWADETHTPLTADNLHLYATAHPGTLPAEEVTDLYDDHTAGDLNFRYHLALADETRSLHLVVHDMTDDARVIATVGRANLYQAAADMCSRLAQRGENYLLKHAGAPLPGSDPEYWRDAAAEFRRNADTAAANAAAANLTAQFTPGTDIDPHPAITVAGVQILGYLDHTGTLRVSVHLDEAADWLQPQNNTVAVRISVNGNDVFRADPPTATTPDLSTARTCGKQTSTIPPLHTATVAYNADACRAWLDNGMADQHAIHAINTADLTVAAGLERLLDTLWHQPPPRVWRTTGALGRIRLWRTTDDHGPDGGAVITLELGERHKVQLAAGHLAHDEFTVDPATTGIDAAVEALAKVAATVNNMLTDLAAVLEPSPHNATGDSRT